MALASGLNSGLIDFLPEELRSLEDLQRDIPRIAKDRRLIGLIEQVVQRVPTDHQLYHRDSRWMAELEPESVHLVLTSPPYWTLKEYRKIQGQLGYIADYEEFLAELDKVWKQCFRALVPGGRLICIVGDVLLVAEEKRRKAYGRASARLDSGALSGDGV